MLSNGYFVLFLGRAFSSNPRLKTIKQTAAAGSRAESALNFEPSTTDPAQAQSRKVTVEEVEDQDEVVQPINKKKKPKKKRSTLAPVEPKEVPSSLPIVPCVPSSKASHASYAQKPAEPIVSPLTPSASPKSAKLHISTSFGVDRTTAQSARSYLQSENLVSTKRKVKSRPNHATTFSTCQKNGPLYDNDLGSESEIDEKTEPEINYFARLGKLEKYMHQLLGTSEDEKKGSAGIKWRVFLKV